MPAGKIASGAAAWRGVLIQGESASDLSPTGAQYHEPMMAKLYAFATRWRVMSSRDRAAENLGNASARTVGG